TPSRGTQARGESMSLHVVICILLAPAPTTPVAQDAPPVAVGPHACKVDLSSAGQMQDILSNALTLGLHRDERRVRVFLEAAREESADGPELLRRSAREFGL